MAGEIFISYRRSDRDKAELLHRLLKERGVEAWYDAHVTAGEDWRLATAKALEAAPIFVLLFSQAASESDDIAKELAAATFEKKLVVPVRIENIRPKGQFLYELASRNWIDAYENTEAKMSVLADQLAGLVKGGAEAQAAASQLGATAPLPPTTNKQPRWLLSRGLVLGGVAVVAAALVGAVWMGMSSPGEAAAGSNARIAFFGFAGAKDDAVAAGTAAQATNAGFGYLRDLKADVAPRADTVEANGARLDLARNLGARFAWSGDVAHEGDMIKATARVEDVRSRATLWEASETSAISRPVVAGLVSAKTGAKIIACLTGNEFAESAKVPDKHLPLLASACGWKSYGEQQQAVRELARRLPNDPIVHARLVNNLVRNYGTTPPAARAAALAEAVSAMERTQQLDPDGFATAAVSSLVLMAQGRPPIEWIQRAEKGLERTPSLSENYQVGRLNLTVGQYMAFAGRMRDAQRYLIAAYGAYPLEEYNGYTLGLLTAASGEPDTTNVFQTLLESDPRDYGWELAVASAILLGRGDTDKLMAMAPPSADDGPACYGALRAAIAKGPGKATPDEVRKVDACLMDYDSSYINIVAMSVLGNLDRSFQLMSAPDYVRHTTVDSWPTLFWPPAKALRADARFLPLMEKFGLVDYWKQTKTQPDVCRTDERDIPLCVALREAG